MRCEDVYALHYEVVDGRVEYSFRTSKLTEQSDLDQRWQDVVKDFIAGGLDAVLGNINVSSDIATKIRRTIELNGVNCHRLHYSFPSAMKTKELEMTCIKNIFIRSIYRKNCVYIIE